MMYSITPMLLAWRDEQCGWESLRGAWGEVHMMVLCQPGKMWVGVKGSACPGMRQPYERRI